MRFSGLSGLLLAGVGCASSPASDPQTSIGVLSPLPVKTGPSREIVHLIADLGSESYERRAAAESELKRLGIRPETQAAVVEALRGAATDPDPEIRGRARSALASIDRSDAMLVSGSMKVPFGKHRFELQIRRFADGSAELAVRVDDGSEELFSGKDMIELAERVTRAARERGIPENAFTMNPDGSYKMDSSTFWVGLPPGQFLVRELCAWLYRVPESDRTVPERVRNSWRVDARSLGGPAYEMGIRAGDFISEIDGKSPENIDDLRHLLRSGKILRVIRLTPSELDLKMR